MGTRSWDAGSWASYASTSAAAAAPTATVHTTYVANGIHKDLDPKNISIRESCNSPAHPKATPIILGCDVTGSMGQIAHEIVKTGLGVLVKEVLDRKPVTDPHIMFMGIGDVRCDQAPLQATQFETDYTMVKELLKIYMEGGGGGNSWESYNLPWHFAAYHTSCDAWGDTPPRKGFLFTFGDENPPQDLTASDLMKVYGNGDEVVATNAQLLDALSTKYHVFHILIAEGSHMRTGGASTTKHLWNDLLGQRAVVLDDYTKLGELIISTMQVVAGDAVEDVAASWGGSTAITINNALANLKSGTLATKSAGGVVRL